jgi:RNA-directed DNA polymerase
LERFAAQSDSTIDPRLNPVVAEILAGAILAGEAEVEAICARVTQTLGREWRWVRPLVQRYLAAYANQTRPRRSAVAKFIAQDKGFRRACKRHPGNIRIEHWVAGESQMQPVSSAAGWGIPAIHTVDDLAASFHLSPAELAWFADLKTLGRRAANSPQLQHYHYRLFAKKSGAVRLIESPKDFLKKLQRQVLADILDRVPAHAAAHGFVKGRSIRTFAAPHAGQATLLRLDLKNFFPSIRRARVQSVFRTLGYPEPVADLLGGLCTNIAPRAVFRAVSSEALAEMRALYEQTHLPQGAPTSPALANICVYRMDCRFAGLARSSGGIYTRYADDLAFSGTGPFERGIERFAAHVAAIAQDEGFAINHRKTRIMRRGVRQHLAGLVVNETVNVPRAEFDRLKAILTNCIRNGPAAENRENIPHFRSHLQGRIAFVSMVQPGRGAKLRNLFDSIDWD